MALNEINTAPIVVKKIKKGGHAHHGGSWKVAYADFVTAMMALFLLLWILETTTMEQRKAISDFFDNPSVIVGPGGASTAIIDMGGAMDAPRGEGGKLTKRNPQQKPSTEEIVEDTTEIKKFDELKLILEETIDSNPVLKEFKDQILIDITPEGLRLQIIDQDRRPMFDSGSAKLKPYSKEVLHELAKVIDELPNPISITGHTDASRVYKDDGHFTNWELSAERANAARYELVEGGYSRHKIARVVGLGDTAPLDKKDPMSPVNRRISIIVLNKKAVAAMRDNPSLDLVKDKGTEFTRNLPNLLDSIEGKINEMEKKNSKQTPANTAPGSSSSGGPQSSAAPTRPGPIGLPIKPPVETAAPVSAPKQDESNTTSQGGGSASEQPVPPQQPQSIKLQDGTTIQTDQLEQDLRSVLGNQ